MNEPSDYSDQAIASYVYWMWRRTRDWGKVWFQVQKKFKGETAVRLENVYLRAKEAISHLPQSITWQPGRSMEQIADAASRSESVRLLKQRRASLRGL